jgi:hypothetical protein
MLNPMPRACPPELVRAAGDDPVAFVPEQIPEGLPGDEQDMLGYLSHDQVSEDEAEHCPVEQQNPVFPA